MTAPACLRAEIRGFPYLPRTRVMGVVNVTPDSFSDGGQHARTEEAIAHGRALLAQGADLLDVGGESTRPGAGRVDADEELRRVLPVVEALAPLGPVSIDTTRADVARAAVAAGAVMVNDVSGGLADPAMLAVIAELGPAYVVMHSRGPSADMSSRASYDDVTADVIAELTARVDAALLAGVQSDQLVVDPGLGFAKEPDHSWRLLQDLTRMAALGRPLLVGASRKGFLAGAVGEGPPAGRDGATAAVTAFAAAAGVWAVRVHEVAASAAAVRVLARLQQ
ncbi:MAG TPA: dihydropteroate synthase [Mycobacteriales bacterium]|nr:dihydropteroate synthase [Mycobacteriales bacterium]